MGDWKILINEFNIGWMDGTPPMSPELLKEWENCTYTVCGLDPTVETRSTLLFHLATDPYETTDLSSVFPEVAAKLRLRIDVSLRTLLSSLMSFLSRMMSSHSRAVPVILTRVAFDCRWQYLRNETMVPSLWQQEVESAMDIWITNYSYFIGPWESYDEWIH